MSKDIRHFILESIDFGKFDVVEYKEYQKLENIIKEVREYITKQVHRNQQFYEMDIENILEILDKEVN